MTKEELTAIVEKHRKWLVGDKDGMRANLRDSDLRYSDLRYSNLRYSDLSYSDLSYSNLSGSNLSDSNLRYSDLSYSNLSGSNLSDSNLRYSNLSGSDLRDSDLRDSDLSGAESNDKTIWPHFQLPTGDLRVYKKCSGKIVLLRIPRYVKRTASLVGRKCRSAAAYVLAIEDDAPVKSTYNDSITYERGKWVYPDSYDPDPKVECSHGIHFFLTRREAEEFNQ